MPDEQLARVGGVDPCELDAAPRDDRHAVERDPLVGDRRALLLLPVRFAVAALHQIAGDRLRPGEVDGRVGAGEQATGLDQLRAHYLGRLLLRQRRAGEDAEPHLPGADVILFRLVANADLTEQSGEEAAVDAVRVRAGGADDQPQGLGGALQLAVDVPPLANPQVVEVLGVAHAAERVAAQLGLFLFKIVPEVEQRDEVARRIGEPRVLLIGLRAFRERTLARVLDAEARDDRHHLTRGAVLLRLHHHAGEPRVDRQAGELLADRCDFRIVPGRACRDLTGG